MERLKLVVNHLQEATIAYEILKQPYVLQLTDFSYIFQPLFNWILRWQMTLSVKQLVTCYSIIFNYPFKQTID